MIIRVCRPDGADNLCDLVIFVDHASGAGAAPVSGLRSQVLGLRSQVSAGGHTAFSTVLAQSSGMPATVTYRP
jgi:hypothetical protein